VQSIECILKPKPFSANEGRSAMKTQSQYFPHVIEQKTFGSQKGSVQGM